MKGQKRKRPSTRGGVSTRARKTVSDENEPEKTEEVVHQESTPMRETSVVSLSLDSESEDICCIIKVCWFQQQVRKLCWLVSLMRSKSITPKKIWWKELYLTDVDAHVFTKKKDKAKVKSVEESSSIQSLKGLEDRIVKAMGEGFDRLTAMVEAKLEVMDSRLSFIEKNQRIPKRKDRKIERTVASIESKGKRRVVWDAGRDYGKDDGRDYGKEVGEKGKENSETGEKVENSETGAKVENREDDEKLEEDVEEEEQEAEEVKENSENNEEEKENSENYEKEDDEEMENSEYDEQEAERRRVEADAAWRIILSESDNDEDVEKKKKENKEKDSENDDEEQKKEAENAEKLEKEAEKESEGTFTPLRGRITPSAVEAEKAVETEEKNNEEEAMVTEKEAIETEKEAE
ncbi:LOW QUALITY PROTEIN: hypothetical protein HID58_066961 [Brassica napus]|uniref:Uncharacterized protein n=1 Tax=Brassica napus TaxID=3708 RepID=A0ABQ7ZH64_BRANA|nr:LOW QUALITY PROTEIN: hypothetical protein HID58_066961 [Brassica napus]